MTKFFFILIVLVSFNLRAYDFEAVKKYSLHPQIAPISRDECHNLSQDDFQEDDFAPGYLNAIL